MEFLQAQIVSVLEIYSLFYPIIKSYTLEEFYPERIAHRKRLQQLVHKEFRLGHLIFQQFQRQRLIDGPGVCTV